MREITGNILLHLKPKGTTFQLRMDKDDPDSEKRGFVEVGMVMDVAEFTLLSNLCRMRQQKRFALTYVRPKASQQQTSMGPVILTVSFTGAWVLCTMIACCDNTRRVHVLLTLTILTYILNLRDHEEIGRTSVIPETLNPVWADAHFEMPAPLDLLEAELVIDVYDHDDIGDHDFLGKVVLTGEELAHPKSGKMVVNLKRDSGKIVPRAQKFVKGKLELKIMYREEKWRKVHYQHTLPRTLL